MFRMKAIPVVALSAMALLGCSEAPSTEKQETQPAASAKLTETDGKAIIEQYATVAHATFDDALVTAKQLQSTINTFVEEPTEENLLQARSAWKVARVPYMQTEVFRFGNGIVDDWEGQLNAWPLDEGMIDYVDAGSYGYELGNAGAVANIVATESLQMGDKTLDLTTLTPDLLASLNELGGSEANVATGYHAIEFLLWGQDLNGTASGAGERPATDFAKDAQCTNGNCERRAQYLTAVTDLLIQDLEFMENEWQPEVAGNYRETLLSEPVDQGLRKMLFGMGSLSLGELAGERMKVALEANSTEDEHDCFSDNTHNSHFYNAQGIANVFTGSFERTDGSKVEGASIAKWLARQNAELAAMASSQFESTRVALQTLVDSAETEGVAFDQLIASNNVEGNAMVQTAITALVAQTGAIEEVAAELGIQQLNPDNADHEF